MRLPSVLPADPFFVNRRVEIQLFADVLAGLAEGQRRHIALLGLRRIGKTMLLDEIRSRNPDKCIVKLSIDTLVSTPENFALAVLSSTLQAVMWSRGLIRTVTVQTNSLVAAAAILGEPILGATEEILDLLREPRAYGLLLSRLFLFSSVLSEQLDLPILMILDEFQDIRKLLNFPHTGTLWAALREALDRRGQVGWVISGSIVTAMRDILRDGTDPLFTRFESHDLTPFSVEDTGELATRLWEQLHLAWDQDAVQRIFTVTQGFPFYVRTLTLAAANLTRGVTDRVTGDHVDVAFQEQLVNRDSTLAIYCGYLFSQAVSAVRGDAIPEAILRNLARQEGQTPTELAHALHRDNGVGQVGRVIAALRGVDILRSEGAGLWFIDPILPIWIALEHERDDPATVFANPRARARVTDRVIERLKALQENTGMLFERRVHNVLRQFKGQTLSGRLFGQEGEVILPIIDDVERIELADGAGEVHGHPGSVELDAVARGNEVWCVEAKHVTGGVNRGQVDLFARKCAFYARQTDIDVSQRWLVSNTGFRTEARVRCLEMGIRFSTARDLVRIERAVARPRGA